MFGKSKSNLIFIFPKNWKKFEGDKKTTCDNFQDQLKSIVTEYYDNNIYIRRFRYVRIVIKNNISGDTGITGMHVLPDHQRPYAIKIDVNVKAYISLLNDSDNFKSMIFEHLEHELVHIRHYFAGREFSDAQNFLKRITKVAYDPKENKKYRVFFAHILRTVYIEGIAEFYEKEREYSLREFEENYNLVIGTFKVLQSLSDQFFLRRAGLFGFPDQFIYSLERGGGLVMTYSILMGFESKIQQEDLFKMSHVKFVKTYEKSVEIMNKRFGTDFKILFSYNSNKGVVDYNKYINAISKMEK